MWGISSGGFGDPPYEKPRRAAHVPALHPPRRVEGQAKELSPPLDGEGEGGGERG